MTQIELLSLSSRLIGVAVILQSIELLQLRPFWQNSGIWSWPVLRQDRSSYPRVTVPFLDLCLSETGFQILLWLRVVSSIMVVDGAVLPLSFLFLSTWLIAIRWRGTFNGGSDSLTALLALCVGVARYSNSPPVVRFMMGWVAIQITASYAIAGWAKLNNQDWREGRALSQIIQISGYDSPPAWFAKWVQSPRLAQPLCWGVIFFECAFPLAWLNSMMCLGFIGLGVIFHVMNFKILGLNRFFFVWLAGYPVLYYFSLKN